MTGQPYTTLATTLHTSWHQLTCKTLPPSRPKSLAVFSSCLFRAAIAQCCKKKNQRRVLYRTESRIRDVHLFTAKDETLLCWWDALLLFNAFLDALDLVCLFDIQLDL